MRTKTELQHKSDYPVAFFACFLIFAHRFLAALAIAALPAAELRLSPEQVNGEIVLLLQGMSAPVGPAIEGLEVRRELDLDDAGAVGIRGVDTLSVVDEHVENDPRAVGRPLQVEAEYIWVPTWRWIGVRPAPSG